MYVSTPGQKAAQINVFSSNQQKELFSSSPSPFHKLSVSHSKNLVNLKDDEKKHIRLHIYDVSESLPLVLCFGLFGLHIFDHFKSFQDFLLCRLQYVKSNYTILFSKQHSNSPIFKSINFQKLAVF